MRFSTSVIGGPAAVPAIPGSWWPSGLGCSMNFTCRQVLAPNEPLLS